MHKRILLLTKRPMSYVSDFVLVGEERGLEIVPHLVNDLTIEYKQGGFTVMFGDDDLKSFQLVFARTLGENIEAQHLLAEACRLLRIPIIDSIRTYYKPWVDRKSFEYLVLCEKGLPIIPSIFLSRDSCTAEQLGKFGYPCIIKDTNLNQGKGVAMSHSEAESRKFLEEHQRVLVQPFIRCDGDVRAMVVGDRVIAAVKRKAMKSGEFRNNISLGGASVAIELSKEEKELAVRAAKTVDYQIAGVDFAFDLDKKKYVIFEVNISPEFLVKEDGVDVDNIAELVKYLSSLV